ncbi:hypothetical protein KP509_35G026300 [Ceratopteris richardii]|uniref:Apyrase 7 n=1 Tax=Ceratopteris richardii TaxID=49495 RepID=A0A8T2QE55_CERRI|nr:hypothetical protein KP509_35G026300 [Ceratopteris richardii]KAH7282350.1 hypothetical protein KP509_35G026300 [Ceratopteris richardii]KAH7282352.1 hypothetical protein KP509_35G026300 [Ceratopteris richardii]KAH7282356.1 hypothetical protein KP509_35G026300 [Ceratopteris richardii]KAH7282357.1 hypothetical protein KP509_35G026300 [Ceratopteris richardii]
MGFKSISKIAAAAMKNPFSSSSSVRTSSSFAALPSFGISRADYGYEDAMQASVSVQDLALYGKASSQDDACIVDFDDAPNEAKPLVYHSQQNVDDSNYTPKPEKNNAGRPKVCCKLLFLLLTAVLFGLIFFYGFHWSRHFWKYNDIQYSVVLDCGSTSTRVQVYAWAHRDSKFDQPPEVTQPTSQSAVLNFVGRKGGQGKQTRAYHRMETEPGLHKLFNNEPGVKDALEPLLQWAGKQIPHSHLRKTPIFLLATAGMRGIPSGDAEWLLDIAWKLIDESPFKGERRWVKVISGIEEAYYGWVALNYKLGRLGRMPRQPTLGALDLGGSSLQVTFESEEVHVKEYGMNISVGSTEHHLYAFSHTGFGLNDAFDKSVGILWNQMQMNDPVGADMKQELHHPCLNRGFQSHYKCSYCNHQQSPSSGLLLTKGTSVSDYIELKLIGKPDWETCKALAGDVVNASIFALPPPPVDCSEPPCALGRHQPTPHGEFYALSGFFVVYKFFGLQSTAGFAELLEQGKAFCEKPWKKALNSVVPQPLVEHYCFRAPYVVELLQNGLHLNEDQVIVGSGDITWTLGAALMEAGAFSPVQSTPAARQSGLAQRSTIPLTFNASIFSVLLLAMMVLFFFLVTYFQNWFSFLWWKPLFTQLNRGTSRTSVFLSPFRLGIGRVETSLRGEGKSKAPHSPAPLSTSHDLAQLRFASLPAGFGKSALELADVQPGQFKGSQLSSRRTLSRDDLFKYST